MAEAMLTKGAIPTIINGGTVNNPVLQMLGFKKIGGNSGGDRFRLLLSDGQNLYSSCMLSTQMNNLIMENKMDENCLIRCERFVCNTIQDNKKVIILVSVSVIKKGSEVGHKLGNPQSLRSDTAMKEEEAAAVARPLRPQENYPAQSAPHVPYKAPVAPTQGGTPGSARKIFAIDCLNPYQNRWTIRARVMTKSNIRTWSNSRGEGRLFNVDLVDDSGEIRASAFNETCDRLYPLLEVEKVYYISKGSLRPANRQFNNTKNDYEINFSNESTVEPCDDALPSYLPKFDFISIDQLANKKNNDLVDIVAVCHSADQPSKIVSRASSREMVKRELHLVDKSSSLVNCTLWGQQAEEFDVSGNPVLVLKGARVSEFNGRSLSVSASTMVLTNPDIPEAHQVRGWYQNNMHNLSSMSQLSTQGGRAGDMGTSNWKYLDQLQKENLGLRDKPDYFSCVARVSNVRKENCLYKACPECNKKLVEQPPTFRCEKCARDVPQFAWRLMIRCILVDFSGIQWITCFQDTAEKLLGTSADEIGDYQTTDVTKFDKIFTDVLFKQFEFRLRAKMETYNDENRLSVHCVGVSPTIGPTYDEYLIKQIEELEMS